MLTLHTEIVRCFSCNPDTGSYACERVYNLTDSASFAGLRQFIDAFRYKEVKHTVRTYKDGIPVITTFRDLIRYDVRAVPALNPSDDCND